MEKQRSSPLSFLAPWLSPLLITFVVVNGGIKVQLYRNNQLIKNWHASMLRHALPEPLIQWIDDQHINVGPQPYPLVKLLWEKLTPLVSKKVDVDASALAALEEVSPPPDFALVWTLNRSLERIEGRYEGTDRYLGMGWFQKGSKIWSLHNNPSDATYSTLENLTTPIQKIDHLLNLTIPYLQQHLPTRTDFRVITNFALHVVVSDARSRKLTLTLQCNYPQLRPGLQVPQQKVDVLLANQAIIQFSHQALTPALMQLLQSGPSITLQGTDVPLFIREQLPIMRHYQHISDDMAAKIVQSNPIVSIATLKPTFSFIHTYKNGVGQYTTTARYQYQQRILEIDVLLAAHQQNQRFVQQHGVWFEWPPDSDELFSTIQQQRAKSVFLPEEVMGFDTRRVALADRPLTAHTIQVRGTTLVERGQYLLEQLRLHGIPGGIVGEPKGLMTMFVHACENVLRDNQQARILWLVPLDKQGYVTHTTNASAIRGHVTVASLVTLYDEPALIARPWTLVIFYAVNQWLDGDSQSKRLSQLKWQWALVSATSLGALSPSIMWLLHLPEQYYTRFCARYLFDLERNQQQMLIGTSTSGQHPAQPALPLLPPRVPPLALLPGPHTLKLNLQKIARLHEESEQLRERLTVKDEEQTIQSPVQPAQLQQNLGTSPTGHAIKRQFVKPVFIGTRNTFTAAPVPVTPTASDVTSLAPQIDEDWKIILQQWQPEHWAIITLLYQDQRAQLMTVARKVLRPLSRLIDEINAPVDEQLGDLLVDPDTQTIANHLHATAASLIRWYLATKNLSSNNLSTKR